MPQHFEIFLTIIYNDFCLPFYFKALMKLMNMYIDITTL